MGDSRVIELKIHYGGSMKKNDDDYEYLGELGSISVEWKFDEIVWDRFVNFCRVEWLIAAPLELIWFKSEKEEMKNIRYVYDSMDEEMESLRCAGKLGVEFVEVFIEHECSEHIEGVILLPNSQGEDIQRGEEEDDYSENEIERPKEDNEPEKSEDESPNVNEDIGDEVIVDAADGGNDHRFKFVFEEGLKTVAEKEAYGDGIEEEEKHDDSDDERAPDDVDYPDTPVDSEDEWDEWNKERKGKGKVKVKDKYHGDYNKPPYIWLFQKFNSGLEFKDQLLKYSMNTQYDVKMAKSESNRIAVICCKEKCPF